MQFSEHNAYCCVGVGEKLNIGERRQQKAGKCCIKGNFTICTAYRIVLVGDIKVNKMGEQCGTYREYRNKDGV
jgi:hypothetical protein